MCDHHHRRRPATGRHVVRRRSAPRMWTRNEYELRKSVGIEQRLYDDDHDDEVKTSRYRLCFGKNDVSVGCVSGKL